MRDYLITTIQSVYSDVNLEYLEKYLNLVLNYNTDSSYTESHHILPKSLFPQFKKDKWNLVRLSAKDHFFAHYYLHKSIPKEPNMTYGLWGMCNQQSPNHSDREYIDNHTNEISLIYEEARIAHSRLMSKKRNSGEIRNKTGIDSAHYGKSRPKEVIDKMTANHWSKWRKPWNHNTANKEAWLMAIPVYNKWLETSFGSVKLEGIFNVPNQYFLTIMKHFKKGWIPSQDKDYMEWLTLNT